MEVSMIGSSQVNIGRTNHAELCNLNPNSNFKAREVRNLIQSKSLVLASKSAAAFSVRASSMAHAQAFVTDNAPKNRTTQPIDEAKLYVGLPLDTVSSSNTINHDRAIAAGLKALKLLGVTGVELPVWWGIAEKDAMGNYDWEGYLAVVEMVKKLGMKLHVSLCFHGSEEPRISLPQWVSRIGESDPSIYFLDGSGHKYKDCLSFAVDDLPVLDGKTPLDVYREFCKSFKSAFRNFMGSTITGLSIGLGPDGELRYPSHHRRAKNNNHAGAGQFQCYDKHMLGILKHHAESHGNPLWGLAGPHDVPSYNQSPISGGFFAENGGSWETPYGDFFLSWYSSQLVRHGDRVLSLAASTFKDTPVTLSGKIPLIHSWYRARSHPAELAAGYYNTDNRDGYGAIAEIFSRNSCRMILPGMDLFDEDVPSEYQAGPESLLAQIVSSCRRHHVQVSGQNSCISSTSKGFKQMKKNLSTENAAVDTFTYQRMGAHFFSPEHFPAFTHFTRNLNQSSQGLDDSFVDDEGNAGPLSGKNVQVQAA